MDILIRVQDESIHGSLACSSALQCSGEGTECAMEIDEKVMTVSMKIRSDPVTLVSCHCNCRKIFSKPVKAWSSKHYSYKTALV